MWGKFLPHSLKVDSDRATLPLRGGIEDFFVLSKKNLNEPKKHHDEWCAVFSKLMKLVQIAWLEYIDVNLWAGQWKFKKCRS